MDMDLEVVVVVVVVSIHNFFSSNPSNTLHTTAQSSKKLLYNIPGSAYATSSS